MDPNTNTPRTDAEPGDRASRLEDAERTCNAYLELECSNYEVQTKFWFMALQSRILERELNEALKALRVLYDTNTRHPSQMHEWAAATNKAAELLAKHQE